MRSLLTKLGLVLALCSPAFGQFFALNGQCSKGGQAVVTQGLKSSATTPIPTGGAVANGTGVLASYPSCSVNVYVTATTNRATIFSDAAGSHALTNPFTANTDGSWLFFTAQGQYDITMTGGGLPVPVTLTGVAIGGGGGGGGGGGFAGTQNRVTKFTTPSTIGNSSMTDDGLGLVLSPNGLSVVGSAYGLQYPNSANGSTNNLLACIDPTSVLVSQVTTCPISALNAIGVVHSGGGATGNAQVSQSGFENCIFDNQTIIGDSVVPSTTAAGQCSDAGAVRPPQTQGIGRVVTVNSGAGTAASVQIFSLDISAPGASGGSGTVSNCGVGGTIAYYGTSGNVVSCDTSTTDDGLGHVTSKSVGTTDATKAGFMWLAQGTDPGVPGAGKVQFAAPAAVASPYEIVMPGNHSTGCFFGTDAAGVVTVSFAACAGSSYPVDINGSLLTANDTINFNDTTPVAAANGLNVKFQTSRAATTDSVSAYVPGDGNSAHYLSGLGTFTTPPGTYVLPTQYTHLRCESGLGDGLNAVTAGTYLQSTCYNDSGVTWTIVGIKCFTDNNGTSTLNATNGAATGLLTGAVTCTNAFAAGSQSATTTIANGDYIKFTFVADGTSKQTTWVVSFTQ